VLFVLSVLVFAMVRVIPGDPATAFVDPSNPDPAQIAQIRSQLGLDRPWSVQYLSWIGGALHGDFGRSLTQPYTVNSQLALRFPVSLELGLLGTLFAILQGILAGYLAVVWYRRFGDAFIRLSAFAFLSVPPFVFGTIVLLVNSVTARARLIGYTPFLQDPGANLSVFLLPAFLLSLGPAALVARYLRGMLLDALREDYVRTARAKGVPFARVVTGHALRNALIPVVTVVGIQLAALIGGTVIVENVFALPGMGSLLIGAIGTSDYPTIQAAILVIGTVYIILNLIVDLLYPVIDPRARVSGGTR
jgi:peptide/nickel transport system permease protein